MIKKIILGCSMLVIASTFANAQNTPGECAAQKAEIQNQINYAQKYGHRNKVAGLEKALREVNSHCTDAGRQSRNLAKVAEKERKVAQRKAEVDDAKMGGNNKKIAKKIKKLEDAQRELNEARGKVN